MNGTGDGGETKKAATLIIWMVGTLGFGSLTGFFIILAILISKNRPIAPELLVLLTGIGGSGLASMVVTGLLSLLGRTSQESAAHGPAGTKKDPISTTVDNEADDAIPVVEGKQ